MEDDDRDFIYKCQLKEILELMTYAVDMDKDVTAFADVLYKFIGERRPLTNQCFREFISRYKNDGEIAYMLFYRSRCYD